MVATSNKGHYVRNAISYLFKVSLNYVQAKCRLHKGVFAFDKRPLSKGSFPGRID